MTPKEKAVELVNKYLQIYDGRVPQAKQCAIIALQEMIELLDELPMNENVIKQFAYLQEVKQEIKLL